MLLVAVPARLEREAREVVHGVVHRDAERDGPDQARREVERHARQAEHAVVDRDRQHVRNQREEADAERREQQREGQIDREQREPEALQLAPRDAVGRVAQQHEIAGHAAVQRCGSSARRPWIRSTSRPTSSEPEIRVRATMLAVR